MIKQPQSYLFWLPWTSTGLGQGCCWKINPGRALQWDALAFLPHSTDTCWLHIQIYIKICIHLPTPDPSPPSLWTASLTSRSVTSAGNGCRAGWLLAGAGLLPLLQSRVSMVYVLLLLRCFSCSHTVLPKEHSLGVIFFSSPSSCYAVFFFNSLSSCPVYPLVIYVFVYVWTGWWLIRWYLWLVTIKATTTTTQQITHVLPASDLGDIWASSKGYTGVMYSGSVNKLWKTREDRSYVFPERQSIYYCNNFSIHSEKNSTFQNSTLSKCILWNTI